VIQKLNAMKDHHVLDDRIRDLEGALRNALSVAESERAVPRAAREAAGRAWRITGHKTEAIYRRDAITSESDLREGVDRLNEIGSIRRTASAGRELA